MNWAEEEIQALDQAFEDVMVGDKHEICEDEVLGECVMIPLPQWETFEQEIRLQVQELVYKAHGQFEEIQNWEKRQEIWRDLVRTLAETMMEWMG